MVTVFLAAIGGLYVLFAVWCTIQPAKTAQAVGLSLQPGSGESEYMVVYGGLQLAMGLVFLLPLIRPDAGRFALLVCIVLHGAIVGFRLLSFLRYSGITQPTYYLAGLEAAILIAALVVWRLARS